MDVMEDGNLMDKVLILIQRDMEYYKSKQSVLQETICAGIVGGRLDFPRYASFAAVKLVLWWEEEFIAAYRRNSGFIQHKDTNFQGGSEATGGCGGIVKASDPNKFVSSVIKSSDQFLDHLHKLTQEALDHADLSVLTGTIGATALIKNCLWYYTQSISTLKPDLSEQLQPNYKKYQEMGEALAERLLDLHCRLLSLYILQDADCLDWESTKPFFESERGSYIIQMWWLYMEGTREDLWNTVPPKMAQRVFSGMLNETLTILTVRYAQACCSEARSQLMLVDISNLLLCVAQLLPAICNDAEEFIGVCLNTKSKVLRDVHAKSQELLNCFVLRGAPLDILHKVFRKGSESAEALTSRNNSLSPWITFGLPDVFQNWPGTQIARLSDLPDDMAIAFELSVLLKQPQPIWSLLLKVLCMRGCKVLKMVMRKATDEFSKSDGFNRTCTSPSKCKGFLCVGDGICKEVASQIFSEQHHYDLVSSCAHVILSGGNNQDFAKVLLPLIAEHENWGECFDRRQIWNQKRPPWFEAILDLVKPILPSVTETVVLAVRTGASMYQAMSVILVCFSQLWDGVNPAVPQIAVLLQDLLPANVVPMGKSALLHLILSALYTDLLKKSEQSKEVRFTERKGETDEGIAKVEKDPLAHKNSVCSFDGTVSSDEAIALAVAEAICSIDEDNKHTDHIEEFLEQAKQNLETDYLATEGCKRVERTQQTAEVLASDLLMTSEGKRSLKVLHHFIKNNCEWFFQNLHVGQTEDNIEPNRVFSHADSLLYTMFHIGHQPFDQLLTGKWKPDWLSLLNTPMGLSVERIWTHLSLRWEFKEANVVNLCAQDAHVVTNLIALLKPN